MDCCSCFEFFRRKQSETDTKSLTPSFIKRLSQEHLLSFKVEDSDNASPKGFKNKSIAPITFFKGSYTIKGVSDARNGHSNFDVKVKDAFRELKQADGLGEGDSCYEGKVPVKMTYRAVRTEDFDGNKMVNEYVRECLIGTGSYGKVVLHRSKLDGRLYAMKILRKSRLRKVRVAPSQTAMTDVLREVEIMKHLDCPRVVKLIEIIDDPDDDHFYMVLEYVEGRRIFEGSGPPGGIGEANAQRYFRDVVEGLMYLHSQNVIHGDIKPENLLIASDGRIKIGDFSISQIFKDNDDELHRSSGTPVFTAPECSLGLTYHGKPADVWALGVTLFCMAFGHYPFLGDTLQDMYDKIVHEPLQIPEHSSPELVNLLEGLLCKDPNLRLTLDKVASHAWVVKGFGPLLQESQ